MSSVAVPLRESDGFSSLESSPARGRAASAKMAKNTRARVGKAVVQHKHQVPENRLFSSALQSSFKQTRLKSNGQYLELLERICGNEMLNSRVPGYNVENICKATLQQHSRATRRILMREMLKQDVRRAVREWESETATLRTSQPRRSKPESELQANYVPCSYHGDSVLYHSKKEVGQLRKLIESTRVRHAPLWRIERGQEGRLTHAYRQAAE
jgi:hypothetical protein